MNDVQRERERIAEILEGGSHFYMFGTTGDDWEDAANMVRSINCKELGHITVDHKGVRLTRCSNCNQEIKIWRPEKMEVQNETA